MNNFPERLLAKLPDQSKETILAALHDQESTLLERNSISDAYGKGQHEHFHEQQHLLHRRQLLESTGAPQMVTKDYEVWRARRKQELDHVNYLIESNKKRWEAREAAQNARLAPLDEISRSFGWIDAANDFVSLALRSGNSLKFFGWPSIKLRRGQSWQDALNEVRRDLRAIEIEANEALRAPVPKELLWSRIEAELNGLASAGQVRIKHRARIGAPVDLCSNLPNVFQQHLFWACGEQVRAALRKELDSIDFSGAMDDVVRDRTLSRLAERRLSAERSEEAIVRSAREAGVVLLRRPDCDPRAVLGLCDE